jgi:hypothetical protein
MQRTVRDWLDQRRDIRCEAERMVAEFGQMAAVLAWQAAEASGLDDTERHFRAAIAERVSVQLAGGRRLVDHGRALWRLLWN